MDLQKLSLQQKVILGLSAVLLLAYFMPWLDFMILSMSGFSLPGKAQQVMNLAAAFDAQPSFMDRLKVFLLKILYFLPLLTGYLIYLVVTGAKGFRPLRQISLITGGLMLFAALVILITLGEGRQALQFGFWLSTLAGLGLVLAPFLLPALPTGDDRALLTPQQQAELQRRGQQVVSQTGAWLGEKRQQVESALEERRIQNVVGRRLNRTLLNAQDQVIAPEGAVITHELIQQAREAGMLNTLLSSVQDGGNTTT